MADSQGQASGEDRAQLVEELRTARRQLGELLDLGMALTNRILEIVILLIRAGR